MCAQLITVNNVRQCLVVFRVRILAENRQQATEQQPSMPQSSQEQIYNVGKRATDTTNSLNDLLATAWQTVENANDRQSNVPQDVLTVLQQADAAFRNTAGGLAFYNKKEKADKFEHIGQCYAYAAERSVFISHDSEAFRAVACTCDEIAQYYRKK